VITATDITRDMAIDSLYSQTCPACGGRKGEEKSLCYRDFCRLPAKIKADLYKFVGHGYEEALAAALTFLKADKFHKGI
jgi:hypothetical protein